MKLKLKHLSLSNNRIIISENTYVMYTILQQERSDPRSHAVWSVKVNVFQMTVKVVLAKVIAFAGRGTCFLTWDLDGERGTMCRKQHHYVYWLITHTQPPRRDRPDNTEERMADNNDKRPASLLRTVYVVCHLTSSSFLRITGWVRVIYQQTNGMTHQYILCYNTINNL